MTILEPGGVVSSASGIDLKALDPAYAIELVGVTKRYGDAPALSDINLEIRVGEFLVLLGPSGCGKSTILKIIAGLEDATEGDVYIDGQLASFARPGQRNVAMVFQNYALYPHMTVERNIGFPLRMRGTKRAMVAERVAAIASLLGIDTELRKYPEQLSGGQRQRVALGRAIIREPVAFLMDEPLSNLDALLRVQMRSEVLKLHRRLGRTSVYVTHDQIEAMTMANRIVVLNHGVIQQVGSPTEIYARPQSTFVATFVGSPQMNLFSGAIRAMEGVLRHVCGAMTVALGVIGVSEGQATLGIRPEDVRIADSADRETIEARVGLVETVGSDSYLDVDLGQGQSATVRAPAESRLHEGDQIRLRFPPDHLHLFGPDGSRLATRAVGLTQ